MAFHFGYESYGNDFEPSHPIICPHCGCRFHVYVRSWKEYDRQWKNIVLMVPCSHCGTDVKLRMNFKKIVLAGLDMRIENRKSILKLRKLRRLRMSRKLRRLRCALITQAKSYGVDMDSSAYLEVLKEVDRMQELSNFEFVEPFENVFSRFLMMNQKEDFGMDEAYKLIESQSKLCERLFKKIQNRRKSNAQRT